MTQIQHYANLKKPHHSGNVAMFERIARDVPLAYHQPNEALAPWHVQAVIPGRYPVILNFWPCAGKAQREGERAVQGESAIREMIRQALADADELDDPIFESCA